MANEIEAIEDVKKEEKLVLKAIEKYGSSPEHNYGYYLTLAEDYSARNVFLKANSYGVLGLVNDKNREWTMVGNPLAPKDKQIETLKAALEYCFLTAGCDKFVIEVNPEMLDEISKCLGKDYVLHEPRYVLYWPVFDMQNWNGDRLRGGMWKKIRNLINRVRKFHRVRVVDSVRVNNEKLKSLVESWVRRRDFLGHGINRKDSNHTYYGGYLKMIELGFQDVTYAKSVLVDGEPKSITVGWEIPNSNGTYYSAVGIYSYDFEGLGEFTNWDDLARLKRAGYREVNFGGSPKPLLQFKQKFKPSSVYTTYCCSITRKP